MSRVEVNLESLALDSKTMKPYELAAKYGVSTTTIRERIAQAKLVAKTPIGFFAPPTDAVPVMTMGKLLPMKPVKNTIKEDVLIDSPKSLDDLYKDYKEAIGWKDTVPKPKGPTPPDGKDELTVVVSDIHAPYHNVKALDWMIKRTAHKAKRLVIGGDLSDMFNFSKYAKFENHFSPLDEIKSVQSLLINFSEAYETVEVMRGNHDDRFIKYLQRQGIPTSVFDIFNHMHGEYALHPIYVLARSLGNVKVVEPMNKDYAQFCYLHQVGDCVISHAEKFSQQTNKVAEDVIKSLMSYHVPEGVIKPFKVLIQCHTHQAGKTWNDFSKIGIENGCMSLTPDYTGQAKNLPRRKSVVGYTELWQTNGVSDIEKTNFIPFQE